MKNVKQQVFDLVAPIAESFGLEVVEVEYAKKHDGMNLTVFIDKEGGITINDCETLHRAIDEPLDQLNPTDDQPYILNVSSLGLDRPLTTQRDFIRNKGKEIEVIFFAPYEGNKKLVGLFCIRSRSGEKPNLIFTKGDSISTPTEG